MKKSRYTEEQIAFALKQAETGTPVAEVLRRMGDLGADLLPLEEALRRARYGRVATSQAARGREPQAEAAGRRSEPGQAHPAGGAVKKALTPGRRREIVADVRAFQGVSERRSCLALGFDRSSIRYQLDLQRPGSPDAAHPRSRANTGPVRLFPDLYPAAPGRLADQSQAGLPALPERRPQPPSQATAPPRQRRQSGAIG